MRKLLVLSVVSALAAACGGGSSGSNNGGGSTPLTGTIGGRAFTPTEVKALVVGTGSTPCQGIPILGTVGVSAIALEITSYANACSDFDAVGGPCSLHQGAQTVTVIFAKLNTVSPQGAPTITPGTYTIHASTAQVDVETAGVFHACFAQETTTPTNDATCGGGNPTPQLSVEGGTLRLDAVTGPTISGHLQVSFQGGGGSLSGDFTATTCSATPNVCALAVGGQICSLPSTTCHP